MATIKDTAATSALNEDKYINKLYGSSGDAQKKMLEENYTANTGELDEAKKQVQQQTQTNIQRTNAESKLMSQGYGQRPVSYGGSQQAGLSQWNQRQAANNALIGKQNDADGIPVKPCNGVKCTALPGALIVADDTIGQGAGQPGAGGVNEHSRRLIHYQDMIILVEDGEFPVLGGIFRLRFIQVCGDHVSDRHGKIRMPGDAVHIELFAPLEFVHKACGKPQFLF